MEYKGNFKMSRKDYIQFTFFHHRKIFISMPVYLFVLYVCATSLYYDQMNINMIHDGIIFAIFLFITLFLILYFHSRSVYKSYTLSDIDVENIINDTGIHQTHEMGLLELPYDKIYKLCESKNAFYIYTSKLQAIIMAKRYFSTKQDIDTVKSLFQKHINKKKLKLRKK